MRNVGARRAPVARSARAEERSADAAWLREAAQAVELRIGRTAAWPWNRGFWVTARSDYRAGAPPRGFSVREMRVLGAVRRVASAPGWGRSILVLPGLYAALGEALFAEIAEGVHRGTGRPVILLEDRLAPPTLRANTGAIIGVSRMGLEAALVASAFGDEVDVLAFSFGALVALSAGQAFRRVVAWSAVTDVHAVGERLARSLVARSYYEHAHRRAFRAAGLVPPAPSSVYACLAADGSRWRPTVPTLLIHAKDDPIAPVSAVATASLAPNTRACLLPGGGHLGFGAVAGVDVYWLPYSPKAALGGARSPLS